MLFNKFSIPISLLLFISLLPWTVAVPAGNGYLMRQGASAVYSCTRGRERGYTTVHAAGNVAIQLCTQQGAGLYSCTHGRECDNTAVYTEGNRVIQLYTRQRRGYTAVHTTWSWVIQMYTRQGMRQYCCIYTRQGAELHSCTHDREQGYKAVYTLTRRSCSISVATCCWHPYLFMFLMPLQLLL